MKEQEPKPDIADISDLGNNPFVEPSDDTPVYIDIGEAEGQDNN